MPTIERVVEGIVFGEGPHWDASSQSLFFVDVYGNNIVKYTPATKTVTKVPVEKPSTFIIPVEGKRDEFITSLGNELAIISWNGESKNLKIVQKMCEVEASPEIPMVFNDAKCDSSGRLWVGTFSRIGELSKTKPVASFYSIDSTKQLKKHLEKIHCSNGIAFNDKTKKMFYIDSLATSLDQFDFDVASGTISNRKPWLTLKKLGVPGSFDGMTIDSDGNLWVAVVGGSRVLKVDGFKAETVLDTVILPTPRVSSVVFGGANLDELYVTTGSLASDGTKIPGPAAGATYKVTGLNAKGVSALNFKLAL